MYALGEQGAFSKLEVEGYSMEMLLAYDRLGDVLTLVKEYTNMILEQGGDDVRECLNAQHLNDELADIRKNTHCQLADYIYFLWIAELLDVLV